ncbi:GNAT family N-acetyltransferase [Lonepinella sp. BR2271]|uniref:GNAT family N-acetyltransferase n=1 Tax=Lonepinella sp. BR2271 TaxID=3434550 RepID=UPI003F6DB4C7
MNIQHQQKNDQGEFFVVDENGNKIAELTYFLVDDQNINANHTYVSEVLRGQGVADKLYQALVAFIRENGLKLIPSCSYIAVKWERDNK